MTDDIPTDAPLYRCILKKSASITRHLGSAIWHGLCVAAKPLLFLAAIVAGGLVAALTIIFGIIPAVQWISTELSVVLAVPLQDIAAGIGSVFTGIATACGIVAAIWSSLPIWVRGILLIIIIVAVMIVGYSTAWCLLWGITWDDWNQSRYDGCQTFCVVAFAILIAIWFGYAGYVFGVTIPVHSTWGTPVTGDSGVVIACLGALAGMVCGFSCGYIIGRSIDTIWYYLWRKKNIGLTREI